MRFSIGKEKGKHVIRAFDSGDRQVASSAGDTVQEAATWLVRHVNRIAAETEQFLVESKILTETECDAAGDLLAPILTRT